MGVKNNANAWKLPCKTSPRDPIAAKNCEGEKTIPRCLHIYRHFADCKFGACWTNKSHQKRASLILHPIAPMWYLVHSGIVFHGPMYTEIQTKTEDICNKGNGLGAWQVHVPHKLC